MQLKKVRRLACKPGSVPRKAATIISLVRRLPDGSSDLPEGRSGPDQPCPLIWSCSRWHLPSQPVTTLLVGSYIKERNVTTPFHPYHQISTKYEVRKRSTCVLVLCTSYYV